MEKVQKGALRFVYNDFTSSYEELLAKGNHSTLYITRLRYMATEFYKCINSLNPTYLQDMVTTINTKYTLGNAKSVQQPKYNKKMFMASILSDIKVKKYVIVYLLTSKIVLP